MTSPRKNFNYNSPYINNVQQYPSQSEDYISLDMGGPRQQNNGASTSSESTPGRYHQKYYQQNFRNSNSKSNRRSLFNNAYGQQSNRSSFTQRQNFYGPRNSIGRFQHQQNTRDSIERRPQHQQNASSNKKNIDSFASYLHPSMTEDPWRELMQRIHALENSKISLNEISVTERNSSEPDTNLNGSSDSNNEEDSVTSD